MPAKKPESEHHRNRIEVRVKDSLLELLESMADETGVPLRKLTRQLLIQGIELHEKQQKPIVRNQISAFKH